MVMETIKVDKTTKEELAQLARDEQRSESDVIKGLVATYKFDQAFAKVQKLVSKRFDALGIKSVDQMEEYLGGPAS